MDKNTIKHLYLLFCGSSLGCKTTPDHKKEWTLRKFTILGKDPIEINLPESVGEFLIKNKIFHYKYYRHIVEDAFSFNKGNSFINLAVIFRYDKKYYGKTYQKMCEDYGFLDFIKKVGFLFREKRIDELLKCQD